MHTANRSGMAISHVGQSHIHTPYTSLLLKDVLHVPNTKKNLVSANRLASDNNVFLELHPKFFSIKDRATRRVLHRGPSEGGLYPIADYKPSKHRVLSIVSSSPSRWHCRLGHPASTIVDRVLRNSKLPVLSESNKGTICDACQQGKSHQLPYPRYHSVSHAPLELVFSDV